MQISLKKYKLFFVAMATGVAFFGGILQASAFTSTTTSSKYVFNVDPQFIRCVSGATPDVMAYCNYILSNFATVGTVIYVSGVGLNDGVEFTVTQAVFAPDRWTLIGSGVPATQTEFVDSYGGYILSDEAPVGPSPTSTPTTTAQFDYTDFFNVFLLFGLFLYFLLIVYIVKKQLIKFL